MKKIIYSILGLILGVMPLSSYAQNTLVAEGDPNGRSYLVAEFVNGEVINGTFPGWCMNANLPIEFGDIHRYTFYSSLLDQYPDGLVDKPENLDAVNWLINQKFVGKPSSNDFGLFTFGDQQVAIWTLLNFNFTPGQSVDPWEQVRVDELISKALTRGDGFRPACNQIVGIIVDPTNQSEEQAQTLIIEIPRRYFPKCAVPQSGQ